VHVQVKICGTGDTEGSLLCARSAALMLALVIAPAALAAQSPSQGQDSRSGTMTLRAGVQRSDNVGFDTIGLTEGELYTLGTTVDYARDGSRGQFAVQGSADYTRYPGNFDSQLVGTGSLRAGYAFRPETFLWTVEDTYGAVSQDPFAPASPDNTGYVNFFNTGPLARLNLARDYTLEGSATYSRIDYTDAPFDSTRYGGRVALRKQIKPGTSLGLEAERYRNDYAASAGFTNYDADRVLASYVARNARNELSMAVGYGRQTSSVGDTGAMQARLLYRRAISPRGTVTLGVNRELSDAANFLRGALGDGLQGDGNSPVPGGLVATAESPVRTDYRFAYVHSLPRSTIEFFASQSKEDYRNNGIFDRTGYGGGLTLERRMSPRHTFGVQSEYFREDFDVADVVQHSFRLRATSSWRLGRKFFATLQYTYSHGKDSDGSDRYTERRYGVFVNYSLLGSQF
jgi:hypothetical protein